jgi:hypothetical protein
MHCTASGVHVTADGIQVLVPKCALQSLVHRNCQKTHKNLMVHMFCVYLSLKYRSQSVAQRRTTKSKCPGPSPLKLTASGKDSRQLLQPKCMTDHHLSEHSKAIKSTIIEGGKNISPRPSERAAFCSFAGCPYRYPPWRRKCGSGAVTEQHLHHFFYSLAVLQRIL